MCDDLTQFFKTSSPGKVAKMLGALSIFMFVTYVMVGVIVFATLTKESSKTGDDPICVHALRMATANAANRRRLTG